jgi:hypothetical protein
MLPSKAEVKPQGKTEEVNLPIKENKADIQNETIVEPTEKAVTAEKEGDILERKKGLLGRLNSAKNLSEAAKVNLQSEGLTYKPKSQEETSNLAKSIVDLEGIDSAVTSAREGTFSTDVNTVIQTEALSRLKDLEDNSTSLLEKKNYAQKFADIAIELDNQLRNQGRSISSLSYFYKKSPLGMEIIENKKREIGFKEWSKSKEGNWKEVFNELIKTPELEKLIKEEVAVEIKKERAENRAARQASVHKSIDTTINKWIDILTPEHTRGAHTAGLSTSDILKTAGVAMKKAYDAGESIAKIIQDATDYISKQLGHDNWDKEAFRKDWEEKIREKVSSEEAYRTRLKNQIKSLEDQIEAKRRTTI